LTRGHIIAPDKSSKKVAAKFFILQGGAEPLSSAPVWAEPSQLLIGMWPWPKIMCLWANKAAKLRYIESVSYGEWEIEVSGQRAILGITLPYSLAPRPNDAKFPDCRLRWPTMRQLLILSADNLHDRIFS
jgi:hypothetical protein